MHVNPTIDWHHGSRDMCETQSMQNMLPNTRKIKPLIPDQNNRE